MPNQSVSKDIANRQLIVKRSFKGSVPRVWECWTQRDLLDKWWGPRTWPAKTDSIDFREGGYWHYHMTGPDGTKVWSRIDYEKINAPQSFTAQDSFCDEKGAVKPGMPSSHWLVQFTADGDATLVTTTLTFSTVTDMQTIIEMGFEAGYTDQLDRLDDLLAV
ncbi:MAG: SRPBCC domain-containing protein [Pseudomonadota bacterium]